MQSELKQDNQICLEFEHFGTALERKETASQLDLTEQETSG